jgi:hypothetical protein
MAAINDAPAAGAGRGGGRGPAIVPTVNIEWDGLDRRIQRLTGMPGAVNNVIPAPDSRTYAFMSAGGGAAAASTMSCSRRYKSTACPSGERTLAVIEILVAG